MKDPTALIRRRHHGTREPGSAGGRYLKTGLTAEVTAEDGRMDRKTAIVQVGGTPAAVVESAIQGGLVDDEEDKPHIEAPKGSRHTGYG